MPARLPNLVALAIVPALLLSDLPAQDGTAERLGRRIDESLEQLTEEVQEAWSKARQQVDQLGVQGRVYGRLRWDKSLAKEPINVDVEAKDTVILTGRVPSDEARKKAIQLAKDTVGVREVTDRLDVEPRQQPPSPSGKRPE